MKARDTRGSGPGGLKLESDEAALRSRRDRVQIGARGRHRTSHPRHERGFILEIEVEGFDARPIRAMPNQVNPMNSTPTRSDGKSGADEPGLVPGARRTGTVGERLQIVALPRRRRRIERDVTVIADIDRVQAASVVVPRGDDPLRAGSAEEILRVALTADDAEVAFRFAGRLHERNRSLRHGDWRDERSHGAAEQDENCKESHALRSAPVNVRDAWHVERYSSCTR